MKIALSTDHTGYELVQPLKSFLESRGHECAYFGPESYVPEDDYPDFIFPAVRAVAAGEYDFGIIMGGSGQGEAMAANRIKGVRCAVYYGPARPVGTVDTEGRVASDDFEILRLSRQHNDANILSLAARFLSIEDIKQAVDIWLAAAFGGVERHRRRIVKLDESQG